MRLRCRRRRRLKPHPITFSSAPAAMADADVNIFNFHEMTWRESRCASLMVGNDCPNHVFLPAVFNGRPAHPASSMSNGKRRGKNRVPSRCASATNEKSSMNVLRNTRRGRTSCSSAVQAVRHENCHLFCSKKFKWIEEQSTAEHGACRQTLCSLCSWFLQIAAR